MEPQNPDPLRVFVSYRRTDSPGHAGRIQDALRRHFGKAHVFYDVATLQGGVDFTLAIKDAIAKAAVVVVIVGPNWARRRLRDRLFSRTDWVQFEIEYARELAKPIVPVVVGGAAMPSRRSLPDRLHFLSTINAASARDESWESDVERLIARLPIVAETPVTLTPATAAEPRSKLTRYIALAAVVLLLAVAVVTRDRWWTARKSAGPNRPPTTGTIELSPSDGYGLMSATKFVFTAQGITDPDGDPIRYTWDFGDGSPPPRSAASVTKVYDRVSRFDVKLLVSDGKRAEDVLGAEAEVTVLDVSGSWHLTLKPDPSAQFPPKNVYVVTLIQQGNQLSGRIVVEGSTRPTAIIGNVEHPNRVFFGSEHPWWNDNEDGYFDLKLGLPGAIQMTNRNPGNCGLHLPCLSALANKQ